jgi:hypothetical protein
VLRNTQGVKETISLLTTLTESTPARLTFPLQSALTIGQKGIEPAFQWTQNSLLALGASCVCGVGMSYSGFRLRKEVSATSFTVIGILCKLGTVVSLLFKT